MPPQKPFRLATTSFIFPDHILPNVIKLGPVFDEIELLVFESRPPATLPSITDVKTLASLSRDLDLTYNVHLPTDVRIGRGSAGQRRSAVDTLKRVIDRFSGLNPTTYTLHLEKPGTLIKDPGRQKEKAEWIAALTSDLSGLLPSLPEPGRISAETLDYPFSFIEETVLGLGLSVCLDLGHGIYFGHDVKGTYIRHKSRISVIHLHGVEVSGSVKKDHRPLDVLSDADGKTVLEILGNYTGVVSLEVFGLNPLNRCLSFLSAHFSGIPQPLQ